MAANKNAQIAESVLAAVGGKENIVSVTHCMTRLRFNLKDMSVPKDEEVKAIKGTMGVTRSGGQYQVIVGTNVDKVCQELCTMAGLEQAATINENLDAAKEPLTLKKVGSNIMAYLSGSLTPIIPVVLAAAIFKSIVAVFGPDMLGILSTDSDLYTLFTFVGDAGYYFFPLLIGYTAAKKLNATPVMGIFMGAILLHPTFVSMATDGTAFSVYGIPCTPQNYSSTILPILLTVWVMSYVERFFKRYIPDALKIMLVPTLTTAVMLPIALCVCGPIGGFLGNYICAAVVWIGDHFGFVGAAVIGALWEFLVMTGMHHVLIAQMIQLFAANGFDPVVSLGAVSASMAVTGMCLGMAFALRDKEDGGCDYRRCHRAGPVRHRHEVQEALHRHGHRRRSRWPVCRPCGCQSLCFRAGGKLPCPDRLHRRQCSQHHQRCDLRHYRHCGGCHCNLSALPGTQKELIFYGRQ